MTSFWSIRSRLFAGMTAGLLLLAGWAYAQRNATNVNSEMLLPRTPVLFAKFDGAALHVDAYRKTAAYEAFETSGLMAVFERLLAAFNDAGPEAARFAEAGTHLQEHGLSLAIAVEPPEQGPPRVWGTIVVHEAGGHENVLGELFGMFTQGQVETSTETRGGRMITSGVIDDTPFEFGWWSEKNHIVIAVGMGAIDSALAVADGDAENLSTSPLWARYTAKRTGYEQTGFGWLNLVPLREMFGGMPIPTQQGNEPATVLNALEALGLANLDQLAGRVGYQGRSQWSEFELVAPGESKGLMALARQKPFKLTDLPALPEEMTGLVAGSFNASQAHDTILGILKALERFIPPGELESIHEEFNQFQQKTGITLKRDLLDPLGTIHCVYNDARQGGFGLGATLAVQVKDAARLERSLKKLVALAAQEADGEMLVRENTKAGRNVTTLSARQAPVFTPAICVDKNWLIVGLMPQSVEAFLMRQDGKLAKWSPDADVKAALAELPQEFTSLTIVDPSPTYQFLLGFAPMIVGGIEMGVRESGRFSSEFVLPITGADLPPAELVTRPMFANVAVTVVEEGSVRTIARQSAPGIPFLGGGADGATSIATISILTALLLPAVQQAREAARRTQSKNNLKQLALSLFNYHDVNNSFPQGVIPGSGEDPEESLSWIVSILPYLDEANLYDQIEQKSGWRSLANAESSRTELLPLLNPGYTTNKVEGNAATHYVGIAGVGEDGPTLPVTSPRAGVFAYNRKTGFRDITDGSSNTIMLSEATEYSVGPWAAGGPSTIRALTQQPYFNGPDGLGSSFVGGFHVGLADGSVRFVSDDIDPSVLEALSTIRGGERVGTDF